MAAPWFRVESSMMTHPKVYNLAELLKLKQTGGVKPNVIAAGLVVGVWSWAAQNAADGDLTRVSPALIADAAGWTKKPQTFFSALEEAGFLDRDGDEVWLHDWINYAEQLAEQETKRKAATTERVRRHRESKRQRNVTETQCNAPNLPHCNADVTLHERYGNGDSNVTETQCNAPYITEHNITEHNNPLNIDRKESIHSTSISACNVTNRDDSPELPAWVNDPNYIPTNAQIEALQVFSVKMEMIKRRRDYLREHPEHLAIERSKG